MKRLFLLIIASISVTARAQDNEKLLLTLEDAIYTALENNYSLQSLEVAKLSSDEDVAQSIRELFPDLNANLTQSISNKSGNGNYNVSSSVILWAGGQGINAIKRARLFYDQADSQITQEQNNLTIDVVKSFLSVLMNEELYNYQLSVVEISKQQLEQGKVKFESGNIIESDYLLLKSQYASDNFSLVNSKSNRDNALVELKALLSLDTSDKIEVVTPSDLALESLGLPTLSELIEETMAWLPDMKIAEQNLTIANTNLKIAKGGLYPTLSLNGSIGTNYNSLGTENWGGQLGSNYVNQIGVSLSIPLWNKGRSRSEIKQSNYKIEQAELSLQQTELNIKSSLEKEYSNVLSLKEEYSAAEISHNAYKETFEVFSFQFEAGAVSTTDMLQQQNNYLQALNRYIQSKYSYLLNCKVLDVYMGREIIL